MKGNVSGWDMVRGAKSLSCRLHTLGFIEIELRQRKSSNVPARFVLELQFIFITSSLQTLEVIDMMILFTSTRLISLMACLELTQIKLWSQNEMIMVNFISMETNDTGVTMRLSLFRFTVWSVKDSDWDDYLVQFMLWDLILIWDLIQDNLPQGNTLTAKQT